MAQSGSISNNRNNFQDFGSINNLDAALNSEVVYDNKYGMSTISFHLTIPTDATVVFEGSLDGVNYTDIKLRSMDTNEYSNSATVSSPFIGSISSLRLFRVRVSVAGSAAGSVIGRTSDQMSTLEGVEFENLPRYLTLAIKSLATSPIRRVTALGNNPDVDQGSLPEDIWTVGGVYPFPTAATSFEVVSTQAADSAAGIGARTIRISGLDANYDEVSEIVTMNGTTPVAVVTQFFRINNVLMLTVGSNEVNVGIINVNRSPGGLTQAQIPVGLGVSRQAIFTVPAGYTLVINSTLFAITRAGGVDKTVTIANFFRTPVGAFRLPFEISISQSFPYRHDGEPGIPIAEKTDVGFRAVESSVSDVSVTVGFLGILVKNTLSL